MKKSIVCLLSLLSLSVFAEHGLNKLSVSFVLDKEAAEIILASAMCFEQDCKPETSNDAVLVEINFKSEKVLEPMPLLYDIFNWED